MAAALLMGVGCNKGKQQQYQTPSSYSSRMGQSTTTQPYSYSQSEKGYYPRQQPAQSGTQYGERSGSQYGSQSNWQQYDSGAGSTLGSSSRLPTTSQGQQSARREQQGTTTYQQRQGAQGAMSQGAQQQSALQVEKARATIHGVGGKAGTGTIEFTQSGKALKVSADVQGLERGSYNVVIANSALCPASGASQSDVGQLQSQSTEPRSGARQSSRESGQTAQRSGSQGQQMHRQQGSSAQAGQHVATSGQARGQERHRLGMFRVGTSGTTQRNWTTSRVSLKGPNSVLGRSVLIVSTGMRAQQGAQQGARQGARTQQQMRQGQILACGVIQAQGV